MSKKLPPGISEEGYNKYVKPILDREKQRKADIRKKWWSSNWIGIVTLFFTIATFVVSILALFAHKL